MLTWLIFAGLVTYYEVYSVLLIIYIIVLMNFLRKLCNKGEDDKMPPLKKKQHEIMRKFQHEQVGVLFNCYRFTIWLCAG